MENIKLDLDIDNEYVYFRVPKRKAKRLAKPSLYMINITDEIIHSVLWGGEVVPHGNTVPVEDVLKEINEIRKNTYVKLKNDYLGRRVEIDGYTKRIFGYITDISLETGLVEHGRGNIQLDTENGLAVMDLPDEENHRTEFESKIELREQKWFEENYVDIAESRDNSLKESIKMTNNSIRSESDLEKYLSTRLYLIEEGMRLVATQHNVKGGIIDILARDKEDRLCIIELKVNKKAKDLAWQCMYYPLQFKDEEGLRMITIAPDYDQSIKVVLDKLTYVEVKTYQNTDDGFIIK